MIRTLSFWRALTAECIATFLYSLLVCLMKVSSADSQAGTSQAYCGLVAGLATATLSTIFLPVSGAHINPAISLSAAVIHRVSPLRAGAYILAQSGGAIAGASVVLGLFGTAEISRHQNVGMPQFGLEFLLSFMIVLAYLRVTDEEEEQSDRNLNPAISIGLAYMTALVAYKGTVNPALALGQAFVRSKFSSLWVLWLGPVLGGCSAALCQEYIFSEQKDIQLSLTNAKTVKGEEDEDGDGEEDNNADKLKEAKDEVKQTKETGGAGGGGGGGGGGGYSVNYKQPLTEQMLLPTPPLPPWKGRKRVQRSYSSEMLTTSDSYYNVKDYCSGEAETQLPTESSGYQSGSLSKQKSTAATGKERERERDEVKMFVCFFLSFLSYQENIGIQSKYLSC